MIWLVASMDRRQGILEWKKSKKSERIGLSIQQFLDRFYLSRIGIRFLIGQRESENPSPYFLALGLD